MCINPCPVSHERLGTSDWRSSEETMRKWRVLEAGNGQGSLYVDSQGFLSLKTMIINISPKCREANKNQIGICLEILGGGMRNRLHR